MSKVIREKAGVLELLQGTVLALGAMATALLAVLSFQTEAADALDAYIVSEAELADIVQQQKLVDVREQIDILQLKMNHARTPEHRQGLAEELKYRKGQERYLECVSDPRNTEAECKGR